MTLRAFSLTIVILSLSACTIPRIIVLHDPLSVDEHLQLAAIYEVQQKFDLARDQFHQALEKDKKSVRAWQLFGDFSFRRKEFGQAEDAYSRAAALDPKNGDLLNNLAWVYLELGKNPEKAEKLARQAIELSPSHRPYYLDTLGVALTRAGDLKGALAALTESVATLPTDQPAFLAEAYDHLAVLYDALGNAEERDRAAARARELRGGK
ncbi:MAG: tetratricopeptide repeat protein [Nitrospiraceae bacterium]|nr:tetratricopeptide repeat protein [Nitrospiraceae bacterium]